MDNRISELPDVIIQRIQSFLETEEAAQTILLSKSWLRAWSTRPFLDFDSNMLWFKRKSQKRYTDIPNEVIDRTLESYVDGGIPVVRFNLYVETVQERWLNLLRQIGVIELDADCWKTSSFQEIFRTKSLKVLRLVTRGSRLSLDNTDIMCLNLKKLELRGMLIDEVTFQRIMCSCPLIEELLLRNSRLFDFNEFNLGICASLKSLSLVKTEINDEQLQTIVSKTPQLEDFALHHCDKLDKPVNLTSVSLKRFDFEMSNIKVQVVLIDARNLHTLKYTSSRAIQIDAPNLHKLKYTSSLATPFPVTIKSPITKGMVKVSIVYSDRVIGKSWFHVGELLTKFAKSNVKFTSSLPYPLLLCGEVVMATPLPSQHEVETLRFKEWFKNPLLVLYAFFTICHPKTVLLGRLQDFQLASLKQLYEDLSYRGNLECCKFQNKCWKHYIKDAKLYYVVDNEQKPLDMNGVEAGLGNRKAITLALEWESS